MLDQLLAQSGLTKAQLSRVLGVSPEQVSRWNNTPPRYAIAYLELYIAVNNLYKQMLIH